MAAELKTATPRVFTGAMKGTSVGSALTAGSGGGMSPVPGRFTELAGTVSSRKLSAK